MTIDVPWRSIFRILSVVVLVSLWLRLWDWILLLVISIFLAVGLDPVVIWLEAHHVRRTYGAPLVIFVLAGLLAAFGYFAGAELIEQARLLGGRITEFQQEATARLPRFSSNCCRSNRRADRCWPTMAGAWDSRSPAVCCRLASR